MINTMTLSLMNEEENRKAKKSDEREHPKEYNISDNEDDILVIDEDGNKHQGSIKVDATCCNVEMRYPTDLDLLNDTREVGERLIDKLCLLSGSAKPKTYHKKARHKYLIIIKKRNKSKALVRHGISEQLGYLNRDIKSILSLISTISTDIYDRLTEKEKQFIDTIIKVHDQQRYMYDHRIHQCEGRIVSVFQPHVRPIVRGKSKAKVEFGPKIGACVKNGYSFIDHFSWDAYNEAEDMEKHIDEYQKRFGCLPKKCYADKIYMNRHNRGILKEIISKLPENL